jgi:hypothetical protein
VCVLVQGVDERVQSDECLEVGFGGDSNGQHARSVRAHGVPDYSVAVWPEHHVA